MNVIIKNLKTNTYRDIYNVKSIFINDVNVKVVTDKVIILPTNDFKLIYIDDLVVSQ